MRAARIVGLGLVATLAVAGAVVWLGVGAGSERATGNGEPDGDRGWAPARELAAGEKAARVPRRVEAGGGEPDQVSLNLAFWDLPMADPVRVRVVEEGKPVPGAEVAWGVEGWPQGDGLSQELAAARRGSWEEVLFAKGRKVAADDRGEVVLPRVPAVVLVAARAGGSVGRQRIGGMGDIREEPVLIALERVREFEIRVVDGEGRGCAGVPVVLLTRIEAGIVLWGLVWKGITWGPEGAARARVMPGEWKGGLKECWAALHPLVGVEGRVAVDVMRPPASPVFLELPPTGSVQVRVVDGEGREIRERLMAWLERQKGEKPDGLERLRLTAPLMAGQACFPLVGLGLQLQAGVLTDPYDARTSCAAGPVQPGEVVSVEIRLEGPALRISGRAVDEKGLPFRRRLLHLRCLIFLGLHEMRSRGQVVQTDAEGRFTFQRHLSKDETKPSSWELEVVAWESLDRTGVPNGGPRAVVVLPPCPPDGRVDLGAVLLAEQQPFLAGRVLDAGGRGLPGVHVHCTSMEPKPGSARVRLSRFTITDGEGRFRFTGDERGWLKVLASPVMGQPFLETRNLKVAAGTLDLEIVLRGTGAIVGFLRLDPDVPGEMVRVAALDASGQADHGVRVSREGRFSLRSLPPGLWSVWIQAGGRLLAEVPQVLVREGETVQDERLQGYDLTGRLRLLSLRLVDGEGLPTARRCHVGELLPGGKIASLPATNLDPEGRIRVLAPREAAVFVLHVCGFRLRRLTWADDGATVTLSRGLQITLLPAFPELPPDAPLPRVEGLELRLRPEKPSLAEAAWALESQVFNSVSGFPPFGKEAVFHLPEPGPYLVEWTAYLDDLQGARHLRIPQDPPLRIQVPETGALDPIPAVLTERDLAAALKTPR